MSPVVGVQRLLQVYPVKLIYVSITLVQQLISLASLPESLGDGSMSGANVPKKVPGDLYGLGMPCNTSFLFLVAMPGATSSFLLLVVMPLLLVAMPLFLVASRY